MKARAAICLEPKEPLVVDEIDVEGPREGECLVRLVATGVCHTDAFTLSGADPEGLFPVVLGHEGAGVVEEGGPGGPRTACRRPRDPPLHPRMSRMRILPLWKDEPLRPYPRDPGAGPDGPTARAASPIAAVRCITTWGHRPSPSTPSCPRLPSRRSARTRRWTRCVCSAVASPPGIGAVLHTAKVEPGSSVAVFGLGGVGLSVVQGAVMAGAERILAVDTNPAKFELARQLGATDCVDPGGIRGSLAEHIVELTGGGVDYSFECVGNVDLMGEALALCAQGLGRVDHHRGRGRRPGKSTRAPSCW